MTSRFPEAEQSVRDAIAKLPAEYRSRVHVVNALPEPDGMSVFVAVEFDEGLGYPVVRMGGPVWKSDVRSTLPGKSYRTPRRRFEYALRYALDGFPEEFGAIDLDRNYYGKPEDFDPSVYDVPDDDPIPWADGWFAKNDYGNEPLCEFIRPSDGLTLYPELNDADRFDVRVGWRVASAACRVCEDGVERGIRHHPVEDDPARDRSTYEHPILEASTLREAVAEVESRWPVTPEWLAGIRYHEPPAESGESDVPDPNWPFPKEA